jgi:hypothetical protein
MWREPPDQMLFVVKQRHAELIREGAQNRLVRSNPDRRLGRSPIRLLSSVRTRFGSLVVVMGRSLPNREAPCNDPCPERA